MRETLGADVFGETTECSCITFIKAAVVVVVLVIISLPVAWWYTITLLAISAMGMTDATSMFNGISQPEEIWRSPLMNKQQMRELRILPQTSSLRIVK